jgi:Fic-DOC domain mobile mystery protein B
MTDLLFEPADAGTPLTAEERYGLIPSFITLRRELNEAEQLNIQRAHRWAYIRKRDMLDETVLRQLHRQMFKDVWRWAGQYRTFARNIGIDAWKISTELRELIENTRYWIEHKTYSLDETAVRFHNKLVWVHPFPNGNGRHARLATDVLLAKNGCEAFTWGRSNLVSTNQVRADYIAALRSADNHNYELLIKFVRS